jgi:hypothetical protein
MAKKTAGKKRGRAKGTPSRKAAGKKPATRSTRRAKPGPRSQALPGLEQVRNSRLENVCESIAETRGEMNKLRGDHAGVELSRVPGEEKLRVRTSRENATAETAEEGDPAGGTDEGAEGEEGQE